MKVNGGAGQPRVTEQVLDGGDLDATFDQVGGKRVSQTVNAALAAELGAAHGVIEKALAAGAGDGRVGANPWKQIGALWAKLAVVRAEDLQERLGEEGVARFATLGLANAQLMAVGAQVLDLDVSGFVEAQPTAINHGEKGLGARIILTTNGEEGFDFLDAEDSRQSWFEFRPNDVMENGIAVPTEETAVEAMNGVDGDPNGRGGVMAFD